MDELSEKITKILNDPGSIQQIMSMASALGLKPPAAEAPDAEGEKQASLPQPEVIETFSNMLRHAEHEEKKQEALFRALRPYLKPGRQERLERALQISHLSHLAGAAIRSGKIKPGSIEGGDHAV